MSMIHGVEVRVPLLDLELVRLAAIIPPGLKQRRRISKFILKEAVRDLLPPGIITRPKSGFGAPVRQWVQGPLREMISDRLTSARFQSRGWFRPEGVTQLIKDNAHGRVDASYVIWALLMIDHWAERFLDN
jgi:asparagine synthase (glutamine-hydrolysing)